MARGQSRITDADPAAYNLTMDPFEKYDMTFNGAVRQPRSRPLARSIRRTGQWLGRFVIVLPDRRVRQDDRGFPNIKRFPGGASNDTIPNLQHPENPVPSDGHPRSSCKPSARLPFEHLNCEVKTIQLRGTAGCRIPSVFEGCASRGPLAHPRHSIAYASPDPTLTPKEIVCLFWQWTAYICDVSYFPVE